MPNISKVLQILNENVEITISIEQEYCIDADDKKCTMGQVITQIKKDIAAWEKIDSDRKNNRFLDKLISFQESLQSRLEEINKNSEQSVRSIIDEFFSTLSWKTATIRYYDEENPTNPAQYRITLQAPSTLDKQFPRIQAFSKQAYIKLKQSNECQLFYEIVTSYLKIVNKREYPQSYFTMYNDRNFFPVLYYFREEVLGEKADWNRITNETLQTYREGLKSEYDTFTQEISNFRNSLNELEKFGEQKRQVLKELEEEYLEKIKITAPVELWRAKSKLYEQRANRMKYSLLISSFVFLIIIPFAIPYIINIKIIEGRFSPTIFVIGFISFSIYIIQVIVKNMYSYRHLQVTCEEKASITQFYQGLIREHQGNNSSINDEERLLVYRELFTVTDSGLVKSGESNNRLESLITLINKN